MIPDQRLIPSLDLDLAEAERLWELGLDTYDIANRMGVHESVVFNALQQSREEVLMQAAIARIRSAGV